MNATCHGCGESVGEPQDPEYVNFHPRCFKAYCRGADVNPINVMRDAKVEHVKKVKNDDR